jgi:hypothetical protein
VCAFASDGGHVRAVSADVLAALLARDSGCLWREFMRAALRVSRTPTFRCDLTDGCGVESSEASSPM